MCGEKFDALVALEPANNAGKQNQINWCYGNTIEEQGALNHLNIKF